VNAVHTHAGHIAEARRLLAVALHPDTPHHVKLETAAQSTAHSALAYAMRDSDEPTGVLDEPTVVLPVVEPTRLLPRIAGADHLLGDDNVRRLLRREPIR
jgi:hypothetical protein